MAIEALGGHNRALPFQTILGDYQEPARVNSKMHLRFDDTYDRVAAHRLVPDDRWDVLLQLGFGMAKANHSSSVIG